MSDLRRHYLSTLAANAAILLLGVVSGTLSARLLGPTGRGELAVILLWPMAFATLGSLGMNQAITFFSAQQPTRRSALLTALLTVVAGQSLLMLGIGWFLLPRLLAAQRPLVLQLAQLFLLSMPVFLICGYLLNLLQGGLYVGASNASRLFVATWYALWITVLFLWQRPSLSAIVFGQVLGYAAAALLNAYWVRQKMRVGWAWEPSLFRPLLSYGAKTHLGGVTNYLNQRLDQLVMSFWLAPESLGFYVVAVTLASPLTILPSAIGMVTLPAAARAAPAAARALIGQSVRTVLVLLAAGALLLFLLVPFLLPLFFGEAFAAAVTACRVLVLAMLPLGLAQILYDSLRGLNRPLATAFAELTGVAVTVLLLVLLLPRYGYLGAALASLGAYTVSLVALLWYTRWRMGLSPAELIGLRVAEPSLPAEAASTTPRNWP